MYIYTWIFCGTVKVFFCKNCMLIFEIKLHTYFINQPTKTTPFLSLGRRIVGRKIQVYLDARHDLAGVVADIHVARPYTFHGWLMMLRQVWIKESMQEFFSRLYEGCL